MSIRSRLAVAIHILALLAMEQRSLTSKYIAFSVNTNPVVIRRILGLLSKANLVVTQLGAEGGSRLAHPPEQITLLDVYQAIGPDALFSMHRSQPNESCGCGRNIQPVLAEVFGAAEQAMEQELANTTLADVAKGIETRMKEV